MDFCCFSVLRFSFTSSIGERERHVASGALALRHVTLGVLRTTMLFVRTTHRLREESASSGLVYHIIMRLFLRFSWDSIRSHPGPTCSTCRRSDSWSSCPDKLSSQRILSALHLESSQDGTRREAIYLPEDTCHVRRHTACFPDNSVGRPSSTQPRKQLQ